MLIEKTRRILLWETLGSASKGRVLLCRVRGQWGLVDTSEDVVLQETYRNVCIFVPMPA